jgi:hypothetical protein
MVVVASRGSILEFWWEENVSFSGSPPALRFKAAPLGTFPSLTRFFPKVAAT